MALGLHDIQLPLLLLRDAADQDMGHDPVLKGYLGIGDVLVVRMDAPPRRRNPGYGGRDQGKDDIDVVDHQVQDDPHIVDARGKRAYSFGLQIDGAVDRLGDIAHGAVEPLDMTDLKDQVLLRGKLQQLLGLIGTGRHRLLHQDMDARLHRRPGHIEMKAGRDDDRDRIRGLPGDQLLHRGIGGDPKILAYQMRTLLVPIRNADQACIQKLRIHPCMMLSQMADANHAHPLDRRFHRGCPPGFV